MAEGARPALGLSIGVTNLAAVTADHAITRKPVLTLFRQRPPEVGVPSENPRLDEPGLVIADFVDRVGDPVGIVAADGSLHRSEALTVDGLRALAYAATGGRPLPEGVAVTYPAHWGPKAVDTLGSALTRVSEWSTGAQPLTLIPDSAATLFAVRANPGIPARGIVALCDFGGSGTSITLVDAAGDYQPVAPTVRHHDFSGDLIDQALLTSVMADLPDTGSFDPSGTSAIGSLARLRAACRSAKEQLSSSTVTTLSDELPGLLGDIRLTRNELEDAIRDSLNNVMAVLEDTLARNGIRGSDLAAVVSVGGGANIPVVTTTLSGRLRVPVVTTPRPQLTAAMGGALRAARGPGDTSATMLTPAAPAPAAAMAAVAPAAAEKALAGASISSISGISGASRGSGRGSGPVSANMMPALAWSDEDDFSDDFSRGLPVATGDPGPGGGSGQTGYTAARPALNFEHESKPAPVKEPPIIPWYRLPAVMLIGTAVAVLIVGIAVAMGLDSGNQPATTPTPAPGVISTPAPASPAPASSAPPANGGTPQSAPPTQAPAAQPTDTPAPAAQPADTGTPAPAAQVPADAPAPQVPAAPAPPAVQIPPVVPHIPAVPIPAIPHIPGI
jgi:Hsp70 protein